MPDLLKFTVDIPVSSERVYRAWLDGGEHSRISGKAARVQGVPGGSLSLLDGQIEGTILSAVPYDRIVQTWRNKGENDGQEHQLELVLEDTCLGSQIHARHIGETNERAQRYLKEWEIDYLRDLSRYFDEMIEGTAVDIDG